jgi:hypothetical protein
MLKRFFLHSLAAWFVVLINFVSFSAFSQDNNEYQIKAAFIVNFLKFIEWPADKDISKKSSIDVCVLGDSEISNAAQVFSQASSAKLNISLVSENNLHNVSSHCHILFISPSEESRIDEIVGTLKKQPVLTVGDSKEFPEHGVMIGFIVNDSKIKLVVNKAAIENAGLHVDAQLLEVAFRVMDR